MSTIERLTKSENFIGIANAILSHLTFIFQSVVKFTVLGQIATLHLWGEIWRGGVDLLRAKFHPIGTTCPLLVKNGKGFPYSIPSVGPGADPGVQAVSLQVNASHPPGGRLPLLSARPAVSFPAAQHHGPLACTKLYCLVTQAHKCEQLAQGCYAALPRDLNPRSIDRKSNAIPVAPPRHLSLLNGGEKRKN